MDTGRFTYTALPSSGLSKEEAIIVSDDEEEAMPINPPVGWLYSDSPCWDSNILDEDWLDRDMYGDRFDQNAAPRFVNEVQEEDWKHTNTGQELVFEEALKKYYP